MDYLVLYGGETWEKEHQVNTTALIASASLTLAAMTVAEAPADQIEDIIDQVTLEDYQSYLAVLTGIDPIPDNIPYWLTNRYSFGADIIAAGLWINDHFDSLGLAASQHQFDPYYGPNEIGELLGKTRPEDIYIICPFFEAFEGMAAIRTPKRESGPEATIKLMVSPDFKEDFDKLISNLRRRINFDLVPENT